MNPIRLSPPQAPQTGSPFILPTLRSAKKPRPDRITQPLPAFEQRRLNLEGLNNFDLQGHNLAWTVLCVPYLLDSGLKPDRAWFQKSTTQC